MEDAVTLFRPVGQKELDLIRESGNRAFPPRLPFQPIFYPVTNEEYAVQIARDWNTRDPASGYVGYVTRFAVRTEFLDRSKCGKWAAPPTPNTGSPPPSWTT